jgi:DnaJ-domain-containing protein 1
MKPPPFPDKRTPHSLASGDPFSALGLPAAFDVDPAALRRAFLERSKSLHPDREGDAAMAAALNAAKATLEDPEKRAEALLSLWGGPAKGTDRGLPDGFLMEMMEVREAIEGVRGDRAAVARWVNWGEERRGAHAARVGELFARAAGAPVPERAALLAAVRRELNAWRYIERMVEQVSGGDEGWGGV